MRLLVTMAVATSLAAAIIVLARIVFDARIDRTLEENDKTSRFRSMARHAKQ
jgi:hypothetical protein